MPETNGPRRLRHEYESRLEQMANEGRIETEIPDIEEIYRRLNG